MACVIHAHPYVFLHDTMFLPDHPTSQVTFRRCPFLFPYHLLELSMHAHIRCTDKVGYQSLNVNRGMGKG